MRRSALLPCIVACIVAGSSAAAQAHDVVIANGRVIDPESGLNAVRNVGIRGDRIVTLSEQPLTGRTVIDARGLIVAPGFIDLHRHGHNDSAYRFQVRDGVTSAFELEVGTADVDAWYRKLEPGRLVNYGVAAGHIPARMKVMHDSGAFLPSGPARNTASTQQVQEIVRLVEQGLRAGALAVGMGLAYTPNASAQEVLQVFRTAALYKVPVHVHLRAGLSGLIETIGSAAVAGSPLHIVHVNSVGGAEVGTFLEAIADARRRGLDVTAEAYPYTAGATRIESALFDDWESWPDARFQTLQWAATGERLTRDTFRKYRAQTGSVLIHTNTEEALSIALANPLPLIASDGNTTDRGVPTHPRASGTFARVLGRYVRELHTMTLLDALRRMTIEPARRLEARVPDMKERGRIRVGAFADVTVFDSATVTDRSSYQNAAVFSEGILHVLVNGTPVVRNGQVVEGVAPGRPIRAAVKSP